VQLKLKVKIVIQRKKDTLKEQMEIRFCKDFQSNRKVFWKAVKAARGSTTASELKIIR
jgi:hypothetical protein